MTKRKITGLTPIQAERLKSFRAEWLAWGTCTDRADRSRAEAAILAMRERIGVKAVPKFIWCESPATMAMASRVVATGASLWASLWASLRDSLGDSLWASLGASLGDSLRDSLWDSLGDSLGASLRASLRASLGASLWDSLGASFSGQHDSYWIAHYLFCRDILGVEYDARKSADLDLWRDIAQSCCWWQCYENVVFISERPTLVSLDGRNVLHAEHGPALAFSDGWAVHAWHGTRIPAEWIEDRASLTPAVALAESNLERRRAACEIIGWARILRELNAQEIEADADPEIGTLVDVDIPDSGPARFLRVRCGTGREFAIPVPPHVTTARQANAWTYGLDANEYKPEFRT